MEAPETLKYTKTHQWVRIDGEKAYVGITDYAQKTLGDIVYVELPEIGREVSIDEELSIIESVKAAEPIYSPLSGTIVEVNETINNSPETLNSDPFGIPLFAVQMKEIDELGKLLDHDGYRKAVEKEESN
jgi:glycine cleavage system H protein